MASYWQWDQTLAASALPDDKLHVVSRAELVVASECFRARNSPRSPWLL